MNKIEKQVSKRNFSEKITTSIHYESPSNSNPYIAKECFLHGYNYKDLMLKCSYSDVLFLMFRGELPNKHQSELLSQLMIFFINPGPRHPASRASMNAAISKSDPSHILPIGLIALGGSYLGAAEVRDSMKFLKNNLKRPVGEVVNKLLSDKADVENEHVVPGFGNRFNSIDELPNEIGNYFSKMPASGEALKWGNDFAQKLNTMTMGWLAPGVVAAVLFDLGFNEREATGIFQIISAPGILAQGVEQGFKNLNEMPFVEDDDYEFRKDKE